MRPAYHVAKAVLVYGHRSPTVECFHQTKTDVKTCLKLN